MCFSTAAVRDYAHQNTEDRETQAVGRGGLPRKCETARVRAHAAAVCASGSLAPALALSGRHGPSRRDGARNLTDDAEDALADDLVHHGLHATLLFGVFVGIHAEMLEDIDMRQLMPTHGRASGLPARGTREARAGPPEPSADCKRGGRRRLQQHCSGGGRALPPGKWAA